MGLGDPIRVSTALARVTGAVGVPLTDSALVNELKRLSLSDADRFRMAALDDGRAESFRTQGPSLGQIVEAEGYVRREAEKKAAAKKGFGASPSSSSSSASSSGGASPASTSGGSSTESADPDIEAIVRCNAFGGVHADLAASHCRGEKAASFLGIWPETSMINHR